jgi:cell division protein ZapA
MSWKQRITIDIAGRPYQFLIETEEDEERIRKAGKLIVEKLSQNKQRYNDKDVQDLLAFAALQFAVKTIELETKAGSTEQVSRLKQICEQLDTFLYQCVES